MQEKFDGKRVLLRKNNGAITGINRRGLTIGLPSSIITSAQQLSGDFIIDGECVGEVLMLVLWGRYDPSFIVAGAEAYRKDVPSAEIANI